MPWMAHRIIGPTFDDVAQRGECSAEIGCRSRLPWTAIENGITDDNPTIAFDGIANGIIGVTRCINDSQAMISDRDKISRYQRVIYMQSA